MLPLIDLCGFAAGKKTTNFELVFFSQAFLCETVLSVTTELMKYVPDHVETGDGAGVLGGGSLGVVEVCGDGDDGVGDVAAQVVLCDLPHLG